MIIGKTERKKKRSLGPYIYIYIFIFILLFITKKGKHKRSNPASAHGSNCGFVSRPEDGAITIILSRSPLHTISIILSDGTTCISQLSADNGAIITAEVCNRTRCSIMFSADDTDDEYQGPLFKETDDVVRKPCCPRQQR